MDIPFREIERKWQAAWEEAGVFEANPDEREKFFLTIPYPYTSGASHVGHGRTYTLGDITARYKRLRGFNVLWPIAWHITGTPVLAIAKRIESGDESVIQDHLAYVSLHNSERAEEIVKTFVNPENIANYYASVWSKDLKELGCSIDWRRQFTTGDEIYCKFIEWQYHHLQELGYLKRGKHPVFFCPSCNNPVTTDDVKGGDEMEMSIAEFALIKEKFKDGFLVAATLRPETVFGVTNVWVNPSATYVKAKVDGEVWYVSKECAEKLRHQEFSVEVLEEFEGSKLVGEKVFIPLLEKEVFVLPASFVDPNVATGVVNSVPAHAPYDYIALEDLKKDENLPPELKKIAEEIKPITLFETPGFSEFPAKEICEKLGIESQRDTEKLEKATQKLYAKEFYFGRTNELCKGFEWLKVSEAKQLVFEELTSRELATRMYENASKDFEGRPVKTIRCRCGDRVVVKVIADQWFLDYANEGWKERARKLLSRLKIIPEVYRKQFEHAIEWLHEWACTRSRGLGTRLPQDRRWIIESLSDSTIYMAFYTIAHVLKNEKISPEQLKREFFDYVFLGIGSSDDVERVCGISKELVERMRKEFLYWYPFDERRTGVAHIPNHLTFSIFHHAAIFPEELWPKAFSLNEMLIAEGKKMSKSLGNVIPLVAAIRKHGADTVRLYLASAAEESSTLDWREREIENLKRRLERFFMLCERVLENQKDSPRYEELGLTDKWLVEKFYSILNEATSFLEGRRFKHYTQKIFFEMMNELESYLRRGFLKGARFVLEPWTIALSPVIPHLAEEIWHRMGKEGFVSLQRWPEERRVDKKLLQLGDNFKKLLEDIRHVIKLAGKKEKLFLYFATEDEMKFLEENVSFLKKEFGFKEVNAWLATDESRYDPQNKAAKAKFGKPGIYVE